MQEKNLDEHKMRDGNERKRLAQNSDLMCRWEKLKKKKEKKKKKRRKKRKKKKKLVKKIKKKGKEEKEK